MGELGSLELRHKIQDPVIMGCPSHQAMAVDCQ